MKDFKKIVLMLFVLSLSIFFISQTASAQGTWRERREERRKRLKERIRDKVIEKKRGKTDKPGDYEFSLVHDGLTRKYKVHIPPAYDGNNPSPLVIYVHGGAGDMRAAYMDGIDKFSDKHNFILAVPEGTGEVKLGHMRANWNGGRWETGECCGKDVDDVGFISKMIDEIKEQFNIDDKMIYATGISNGGLMTNRLGCELSDKIAAIAPVAPAAVMSNCNPSRPVSVMDIHGTADPANPPDGSEPRSIFKEGASFGMPYKRMTPYQVVDTWKKINECSDNQIDGYEKGGAKCVIYNECDEGAEVELCMVKGMGHTYPSGSQYFPEKLVGPVSYDISFDQIWEFFKEHPISVKINQTKNTTGNLYVSSNPPSANLYVDNVDKGLTSNTVSNFAVGSHAVKLQKSGYQDYSTTTYVKEGQTTAIYATLTPVKTNQTTVSSKYELLRIKEDVGTYDPSVEYGDDNTGWLAYSSAPEIKAGLVETNLAKTNDGGKTWTKVNKINAARDVVLQKKGGLFSNALKETEARLRHETPTLLYDPYDPDPGKRWKLFWIAAYLKLPSELGDYKKNTIWQYAQVFYKYASSPEKLAEAEEIRLFGANGLDSCLSEICRVQYNLNKLHPDLADTIFYMEPGSLVKDGVLYLTFTAVSVQRLQRTILISSKDHGETWRYAGELTNKDTLEKDVDKNYTPEQLLLTSSALAEEGGRQFLLVSPRNRGGRGQVKYNGVYIFEFDDITRGKLKRNSEGKLVVHKYLPAISSEWVGGGQSEYHEKNTYGGIIMSQTDNSKLGQKEFSKVYNTKDRIVLFDLDGGIDAQEPNPQPPLHPNIKLSRGGRFNGEPTIAVNPLNPNNLIAAWMHSQKQKEIEIAVVSSGDGGATWTDPFLLGHVAPIYTASADVSVVFDNTGTAHLTYIEMEPDPDIAPSCEFHMGSAEVVHRRSNDGGRTWSAPVRVRHSSDTPDFAIDRPWVAVDRSGGPFNGRVYVVSISFFCNNNPPQHVHLRWSMDQGATWSDDVQVDDAEYGTGPYPNMPFPAAIGVGGDGTVWIVYSSASRKACGGGFLSPCLLAAVSHDGGQTFSRSKVANVTSASRRGFLLFQTIAVDQVRGGRAFVFWPDGRFDSVGSDLLFVQSENSGRSWSEPARINDNPLGLGVGMDEAWAAAADNGSIAVLWRDRRSAGSGSEVAFEAYAAVSVDGGINFTPNVRFSDQPSPYSSVPCCNSFLGLAFGGGRLHGVWADFRENLWEIFYHSIK